MRSRLTLRRGLTALTLALLAAVALVPAVQAHGGGVQAQLATFTVRGAVATPLTLTTKDLKALPEHRLRVTFQSGTTTETHVFKGPLLRDVLALAGPTFDPAVKNAKLRHAIAVTGSDGYRAVVAWGEIDPDFENKDVLLAFKEDGESLRQSGPRLVVPGDIRGGRYVSLVVDVQLVNVDAALAS